MSDELDHSVPRACTNGARNSTKARAKCVLSNKELLVVDTFDEREREVQRDRKYCVESARRKKKVAKVK